MKLTVYTDPVQFAWKADPTANKIYREIGYRQIAEFAHVETDY